MKKALALFLTAALLLPELTNAGIWIDFAWRQDYIARVLCVQKEEPVNLCQGTCFLSKQLRKAQQEQKNRLPKSFSERIELLFGPAEYTLEWVSVPIVHSVENRFFLRNRLYPRIPIFDLLRPPEVILI